MRHTCLLGVIRFVYPVLLTMLALPMVFGWTQAVQAQDLETTTPSSTPSTTLSDEQLRELQDLKARIRALEGQVRQQSAPTEPSTSPPSKDLSELKNRTEETEGIVSLLQEEVDAIKKRVEEKVSLNLYVTGAFESFRQRDSFFDARRVELFASGQITSRLRAFAEIEFERTAKTSPSVGTATNRTGEVEVEQGWLEFAVNEAFKPRAGIVLVPFGRLNLEHFDPVQDLTDRPIAMRRVIPTTWAEAGAGFTGAVGINNPLLKELHVNYQLYVINGLTNAISDTGTRNARASFGADNNANKAVVGRMGVLLHKGMELGFSGYYGTLDREGNRMKGFDVDWKLRYGPVELLGEYAIFGLDGAFQNGSTTLRVPRTMQGGYGQVNYYFWPQLLSNTWLARGFQDPQFTLIFRYDFARIADDEDLGAGANREQRWTVGMNYRPTKNYVFKAEYQWNYTHLEALERGNSNGLLLSMTAAF